MEGLNELEEVEVDNHEKCSLNDDFCLYYIFSCSNCILTGLHFEDHWNLGLHVKRLKSFFTLLVVKIKREN